MSSSVSTATLSQTAAGAKASAPQQQQAQEQQQQALKGDMKHDEFFWTYTEEPHATRRQAIIKAHPEVLKLCGPEPLTFPLVVAVVSLQFFCAYALRNTPFLSWQTFLTAYVIGATANQNLFLAIHEISHNLAFKSPFANRMLAIFANLPIGIPYSASFRPYHLTHHKSLGVDGLDTDLPTSLEAWFLDSVAGKAFFATFQILFYALRPMMVYNLPLTRIHAFNVFVQLAVDYLLVQNVGGKALGYFILSSFLAGSLHPVAGHFIAEHYLWDGLAQETYSYYGALNALAYNVGYHNEHHDFPSVPWTRLPQLRKLAPEFYDTLPSHPSWVMVIVNFIRDADVGLHARAKRLAKPSVAMRAKDE